MWNAINLRDLAGSSPDWVTGPLLARRGKTIHHRGPRGGGMDGEREELDMDFGISLDMDVLFLF